MKAVLQEGKINNRNVIAMNCVTKSSARGFPGSTMFGLAVCAERSRDNGLRFLRKFHPEKIWNTLITITYLHR